MAETPRGNPFQGLQFDVNKPGAFRSLDRFNIGGARDTKAPADPLMQQLFKPKLPDPGHQISTITDAQKQEMIANHRAQQRAAQREALRSKVGSALEQDLGRQGLVLKRGIENNTTEYVYKQGKAGPQARFMEIPKTETAPHPDMRIRLDTFHEGGKTNQHYFKSRYDALSWLRTRFKGEGETSFGQRFSETDRMLREGKGPGSRQLDKLDFQGRQVYTQRGVTGGPQASLRQVGSKFRVSLTGPDGQPMGSRMFSSQADAMRYVRTHVFKGGPSSGGPTGGGKPPSPPRGGGPRARGGGGGGQLFGPFQRTQRARRPGGERL